MSTWFHYIRESRLQSHIEYGALRPANRFIFLNYACPELPDEAHNAAIWGLHCPEPKICKTNTPDEYPHLDIIRKQAARGETLYLLEIESTPTDKLFVCDIGVFKDTPNKKFPKNIGWNSKKGLQLREEETQRLAPFYVRHWKSLVPFDQYELGSYKKPEVVCFNEIPLERIEAISETDEFKSSLSPSTISVSDLIPLID